MHAMEFFLQIFDLFSLNGYHLHKMALKVIQYKSPILCNEIEHISIQKGLFIHKSNSPFPIPVNLKFEI